jgi:hypothetical protein
VPRNSRSVIVDPGVDLDLATVVLVAPFANLRDVNYWVTRDLENDVFRIRLSDTRNRATPFSWLIAEPTLVETEAVADAPAE